MGAEIEEKQEKEDSGCVKCAVGFVFISTLVMISMGICIIYFGYS